MIIRLIFLLNLVLSCAKNQPIQSWHSTIASYASLDNHFEEVLKDQKIKCTEDKCPEGLARILFQEDDEVFSCTGFLVAPNIVMTNSHCVQSGVDDFCERAMVQFPGKNSKKADPVGCSKVLVSHPSYDLVLDRKNDYAFIELKNAVEREVFHFDTKSGIENEKNYGVWVMNSITQNYAEMAHYSCISVQETALVPTSNHPFADKMVFIDCPIIPGNSGSPILNDENKVVGIMYGASVNTHGEFAKALKGKTVAVAHNAACVEFEPLGLGHHPLCDSVIENKTDHSNLHKLYRKTAQAMLETFKRKYQNNSLYRYFEWMIDYSSKGIIMTPRCLYREGLNHLNKISLKKFKSFELEQGYELDSKLRVVEIMSYKKINMRIDVETIDKETSVLELLVKDSLISRNLSFCD
jgi:V8-like Glu-specific endopeptidase